MSYWKQFTAASAAIAAAHIRAMTDVPQSVKDFAAGEIERFNPMGTGEGFVLVVNLTGHSPSGQPYYQTATCKLEAVWMVAAIAPPVDTADKPVEREIPVVSGGKPIERPDFEDFAAAPLADRPDVEDAEGAPLAAEDDPADGA